MNERENRILRIVISKGLPHNLSAFSLFLATMWQGLPKSVVRRLFGLQEHISLEIVGQPNRVQFQIWTPYSAVEKVVMDQLRAHFTDIEVHVSRGGIPRPVHFATSELVLGLDRERPLKTLKSSEADPVAGILASVSDLSPDEWAMIQLLIRPALAPSMETTAFQAIIRALAGASNIQRARNRLGNMIAGFGQFGAENALRPARMRLNSESALRAVGARYWPLFRLNPFLLTLEELTAIYHLPSPTRVQNRYLEVTGARRLPHPVSLSQKGIRVGLVPHNGQERAIRLPAEELFRHLALFGATGTGKSTLMLNMALDLINLGIGVSVMDPHGSLVPALLDSMPEHRLDDVILVRFADVAYPVGLNFLTAGSGFEFLMVDELVEVCRRIYGTDYWGPVLDMVLRHAAYATLEIGGTLVEMARILDDDDYRESILPQIQNPETRRFFERLSTYREGTREQKVASTLHRLQRFLGTPFIRNIVGQAESTIDLREVMDESKILLVELDGIGMDNARFLGSLLTLLFRQTALSRGDTPESRRIWHYLIMDECSWFISRTVGEMADQVRKFGLGLVLAAQRLGQLKPRETREAIFANVGSMVCFQMGERDEAVYLERHFNTAGLTAEEIRTLGRYEVYAQLTLEGIRKPAFWGRTPPPPPKLWKGTDRREQVCQRSIEQHALPREVVEQEIASRERREGDEEPEKRWRQDAPPTYTARPADHPGSDPAWTYDPGPDPTALLPEGR